MPEIKFQREDFYREVWSKPLTQLAKKHGTNNYQLKKVCKKLNIPTPNAGYWSKVKYEKEVKIPSLPKFDLDSYCFKTKKIKKYRIRTVLKKPKKSLVASRQLGKLHSLAKTSYEGLKKADLNRFGRVQPRCPQPLDLSVGSDNIKRAILLFDTLLKELERQGYNIAIEKPSRAQKTVIYAENVAISVI